MKKPERRYISVPERWGENEELLAIPYGMKGQAMVIGLTRAKAIVRWIEEIQSFVEASDNKRHGERYGRGTESEKHPG